MATNSQYLEGQGDLVGRSITLATHILTLLVAITYLLSPPDPPSRAMGKAAYSTKCSGVSVIWMASRWSRGSCTRHQHRSLSKLVSLCWSLVTCA